MGNSPREEPCGRGEQSIEVGPGRTSSPRASPFSPRQALSCSGSQASRPPTCANPRSPVEPLGLARIYGETVLGLDATCELRGGKSTAPPFDLRVSALSTPTMLQLSLEASACRVDSSLAFLP